jgi:hypothetical protein
MASKPVTDDLDPARGIVAAVGFSLLFWGAVALIVYLATH